jgi:AAA-like domain
MPPDAQNASGPPPGNRRLDSWKEIAEYLRRGITTVQRWEREEGLPVRRHLHNTSGSVFAETADIDRWLLDRSPKSGGRDDMPQDAAGPDGGGLDILGGAVPLESAYYVERPIDADVHEAVAQRAGLVLVKGARQVGKSSLLARALDRPRRAGARVAFTDVQAMSREDLASAEAFFQALGRSLADQIGLRSSIHAEWNDQDSPNTNFSRYVQRVVLGGTEVPLVWGLDEVDRLVGCDYAIDVYGLFRSWHNRRALDPLAPWRRLTLMLAYATEAHLLMTDLNQSPFNVGVRIAVDDFTREEVMRLHERHGSPLVDDVEREQLVALVGGHPFLLQSVLHALKHGATLDRVAEQARRGAGPLADHLRRVRLLLEKDAAAKAVMRAILNGKPCGDREVFYRLRSAGVLAGDAPDEARPRCGMYAAYLEASDL